MSRPSSRRRPGGKTTRDAGAQPTRYGTLATSIAFNLRQAHNLALQAFARQVGKDYGRPGRFTILTLIGENPGISQTALSRASGLDISTLTPSLNDLVRRGLVRRQRLLHDRRGYSLDITPAGAAFHGELMRQAQRFEDALLRAVGAKEKPRLLRALGRIQIAFDGSERA